MVRLFIKSVPAQDNTAQAQEDQQKALHNEYVEKFSTPQLKAAVEKHGELTREGFSQYKVPEERINNINSTPGIRDELIILNEDQTEFYSGSVNEQSQKHGWGYLMNSKGEKWEGYWENDSFQPYGRYTNERGEIYEGSYENGKLHGEGKMVKAEKSYTGEFLNGVRNGQGVEVSEVEQYEGTFRNDKKDGEGKLFFKKSQNVYEGDFKQGKMTGKCVFSWANGDRYEGTILNGIFDGKGKYTWNDGMEYEGNYDRGVRRGYGIFKWKDGKIYKGEFEKNLPHGNGVIIHNGIEKNVKSNYGSSVNATMRVNEEEKLQSMKGQSQDLTNKKEEQQVA